MQRFGDTEAYKEFKEKQSKSNNEIIDIDKKAREIFGAIAKYMEYPPSCEKVQKLISMWQEYITKTYYKCTNEMLQCLGKMYVEDQRFESYINSFGDNLAQYINEAINFYCKEK